MGARAKRTELPALLAPLTSLRQLRIDRMTLSTDILPSLLALSLDSLDLSTCSVSMVENSTASSPPTLRAVTGCALLQIVSHPTPPIDYSAHSHQRGKTYIGGSGDGANG